MNQCFKLTDLSLSPLPVNASPVLTKPPKKMTSTKQKKLGQLLGLSVFTGTFLVLIIFTSAVALIIHQSLEKSATQDIANLLNSVNDSFEVFDNAVKADAERTGDNFR